MGNVNAKVGCTVLRKKLSSFALYIHLKSNLYLSHLIQKKQLVMIRYRQEHCGMVLMLLLIRYLFLSTRLLTLALCRLLGSWPKSALFSKRMIPMTNLTIGQCRFLLLWIKFLRSALHANFLIILVLSYHRFCLRIDGATAVRRYFYFLLRIGGMHLTISVLLAQFQCQR